MVGSSGRVARRGRAGLGPIQAGGEPEGAKIGKAETTRWRVGLIIKASGGACRGLTGYAAVPTEWPEQDVSVVEEDISPEVKLHYETLNGGVKIMSFKIAQLAAGQEAKALVTFEVRRSTVLPPENTDIYVLPDPKKLPRADSRLSDAESTDRVPRSENPRAGQEDRRRQEKGMGSRRSDLRLGLGTREGPGQSAQRRLGGVARRHGRLRGTVLAVYRHLPGGRHSRPHRLGARPLLCGVLSVRQTGQGHWFPCQSRGARQFGGITDTRPIFQKGDNIRPPRNGGKERQRFLAESLTGGPRPAAASRR